MQFNSRDGDLTNRAGSAADPTVTDEGVPFADTRTIAPYVNDQASHEIQLISNFSGPFNFIAGYYSYENTTLWAVSGDNFGFHC